MAPGWGAVTQTQQCLQLAPETREESPELAQPSATRIPARRQGNELRGGCG